MVTRNTDQQSPRRTRGGGVPRLVVRVWCSEVTNHDRRRLIMHVGFDVAALTTFAGTDEAADLIEALPADNKGVLDDLDAVAELIRRVAAARIFTLEALPDKVTDSAVESVDVSIIDDGNTYAIDLAARVKWTINGTDTGIWLHSYGDGNYTCGWFDTDNSEPTAARLITYIAEQVAAHLNGELFAQQAAWTAMLLPTEVHVLFVEDKHGHEITIHSTDDAAGEYFVSDNSDKYDRAEDWFDPTDPVSSILDNSADITMHSHMFQLPDDLHDKEPDWAITLPE